MRVGGLLLVPLLATAATSVAYADDARPARVVRLGWPHLDLKSEDGERISSIEVVVICGSFRGVTNIPNDWNLEVVSPSSAETSLRASAGHGATELWNLQPFERSVKIEVEDETCFDIHARVTVGNDKRDRNIDIDRRHLGLMP